MLRGCYRPAPSRTLTIKKVEIAKVSEVSGSLCRNK